LYYSTSAYLKWIGYQIAQQIHKRSSGIGLIALTGHGPAEDIVRTYAAGFDAHTVTPVHFDVLHRAIGATHSKSALN
jgi:DNA-binding NarL/FixJ family response regulator